MRVAFIAAECEPWAKTGGLADVVDALARALGQAGGGRARRPRRRLPAAVPRACRCPRAPSPTTVSVPNPRGGTAPSIDVLAVETHGYRLHLVDHPPAFDRDGLYGDAER